jgi:hypothetical protein
LGYILGDLFSNSSGHPDRNIDRRRKWEPAFFDPDTGMEIPGPEKYVLEIGPPACQSHETLFAVFHHQVTVLSNLETRRDQIGRIFTH